MNVTELEKKHAELGEEIKRFKEQGEGHPDVFTPVNSSDQIYCIDQDICTGKFTAGGCKKAGDPVKNVFRTEEAAQSFADGLNVIMELKACKGARKFMAGEENWTIRVVGGEVSLEYWNRTPSCCIFACFDTRENAEAAIKKIGEARIVAAVAGLV